MTPAPFLNYFLLICNDSPSTDGRDRESDQEFNDSGLAFWHKLIRLKIFANFSCESHHWLHFNNMDRSISVKALEEWVQTRRKIMFSYNNKWSGSLKLKVPCDFPESVYNKICTVHTNITSNIHLTDLDMSIYCSTIFFHILVITLCIYWRNNLETQMIDDWTCSVHCHWLCCW